MQVRADNVMGWGVDRRPEDRPGVPMELEPPRQIGDAAPGEPEQQVVGAATAIDRRRPLTPTYGTCVPLRGMSGAIRRVAYTIPTYKARRWMLLMLADRVDVIEHTARPAAKLFGGLAVIALGVLAVRALREA
jgi:hypothetical protein